MGVNSTKSLFTKTDYSLTLSSANHFYRALSTIYGEFHLNIRTKFRIEKKLRVDLIGQFIDNTNPCTKTTQIFFTYSFPLVTSHENGIARILKQQQITFPFRIPLGINLPPSCELKDFSIGYHLDIYHDGRLLPNIRKTVLIAPPVSHATIPLPCKITATNNLTIICSLQKSFYSARDGSMIPLSISITNPKQQQQIHSIIIQLIQLVSLNGLKYENEILTVELHEMKKNSQENPIDTICQLNLPANLPPTYIPNKNGQPDNFPSIAIIYEFRLIAQMKGATTPNLRLSVPIGIE